jgi:hypothetical protein
MISGRDHRHSSPQQIDGDLWRDATPASRVLPVDDDEIDRMRFLQARKVGDNRAPARLTHNVAQKKNRQHRASIVLKSPKSNL